MGFIECVLCEADHLIVYLIGRSFRYTVPDAAFDFDIARLVILSVDKVFLFLEHDVHLLLAHGSPDQIASAVGVSGQIPDDLHDLLLVDQAAVGDR